METHYCCYCDQSMPFLNEDEWSKIEAVLIDSMRMLRQYAMKHDCSFALASESLTCPATLLFEEITGMAGVPVDNIWHLRRSKWGLPCKHCGKLLQGPTSKFCLECENPMEDIPPLGSHTLDTKSADEDPITALLLGMKIHLKSTNISLAMLLQEKESSPSARLAFLGQESRDSARRVMAYFARLLQLLKKGLVQDATKGVPKELYSDFASGRPTEEDIRALGEHEHDGWNARRYPLDGLLDRLKTSAVWLIEHTAELSKQSVVEQEDLLEMYLGYAQSTSGDLEAKLGRLLELLAVGHSFQISCATPESLFLPKGWWRLEQD